MPSTILHLYYMGCQNTNSITTMVPRKLQWDAEKKLFLGGDVHFAIYMSNFRKERKKITTTK